MLSSDSIEAHRTWRMFVYMTLAKGLRELHFSLVPLGYNVDSILNAMNYHLGQTSTIYA